MYKYTILVKRFSICDVIAKYKLQVCAPTISGFRNHTHQSQKHVN